MPVHLSAVEVRVVGSLLEKEVTTPDTYPLTRNALVAACNQATGRAPVLQLGHEEVEEALRRLKEEGMVRVVHPSHGSRSEKYRHVLPEVLELSGPERTIVCLLALRGPQTPGELKARSDRLSGFATLEDVQRALESLAERAAPLACRLPRRLGQKELRWAHLLSGEPQEVDEAERPTAPLPRNDRLADLEDRVAELEGSVAELRASLGLT